MAVSALHTSGRLLQHRSCRVYLLHDWFTQRSNRITFFFSFLFFFFNALPADSGISLLCNPISSSPYFPSSPSGSLAGFVYWRRGWGEKGGSCRTWETVQSTSVRGRKENNKSKTFFLISFLFFFISPIFSLFLSFGYTLSCWSSQLKSGALETCSVFFLFPNAERSGATTESDCQPLRELRSEPRKSLHWPERSCRCGVSQPAETPYFSSKNKSPVMFCARWRTWGFFLYFFTKDTYATHATTIESAANGSPLKKKPSNVKWTIKVAFAEMFVHTACVFI